MAPGTRSSLLTALGFFPVAGYIIKLLMNGITTNLYAVSSIIQDSCMVLYLVCIIALLLSPSLTSSVSPSLPVSSPKMGIAVIGLLTGVYVASIILNSLYIDVINRNQVEMTSASFWIFAEIFMLFKYLSAYISGQDASAWLIFIFILIIIHSIIIGNNFVRMKTQPTDDAKQNLQ
jgi:hypothetical protein